MPGHSTLVTASATDGSAPEQLLLTISRAGVLSSRVIAAGELETLLRLLGPPSERQREGIQRATDVVLIEEGRLMYWPRTGEQFADPAYAMAPRQSGKSTAAGLKAAWTVLQGGLAVVVSPSLRQSGFLFRKLARHLVASEAAFRRETMTEVELVSGGLAVSLPGDRPAMLRGLSLRHDGPAVLIVDEASRVRDELVGDDLADARGRAGSSADPALDAGRRQRRVSPRLVLGRRLGAGADHR